jgi:hypothetical protein
MRVIERVAEHYDAQDSEFGKNYRWCPENVVVECTCGRRITLKRSALIDNGAPCECGVEHTNSVREEVVLQLPDEDYELHHHPWRYWHTTRDTGIPF